MLLADQVALVPGVTLPRGKGFSLVMADSDGTGPLDLRTRSTSTGSNALPETAQSHRSRLFTSNLRENANQCGSASFETRSGGALLRMMSVMSKAYLTLRRPEGPSRRVLIRKSRIFPRSASRTTLNQFPEVFRI